jgi:hypothetical protein
LRREGWVTTSGADGTGGGVGGLGLGLGFPVGFGADGVGSALGAVGSGSDVHVDGFQALVVWHSSHVSGNVECSGNVARS